MVNERDSCRITNINMCIGIFPILRWIVAFCNNILSWNKHLYTQMNSTSTRTYTYERIHSCTHTYDIMCWLLFLPACLLSLVTDQEQHLCPLSGDRNYLGVKNWGCDFPLVHWESWQTSGTILTSTSWITSRVNMKLRVCFACVLQCILTERLSYRSLNMLHFFVTKVKPKQAF